MKKPDLYAESFNPALHLIFVLFTTPFYLCNILSIRIYPRLSGQLNAVIHMGHVSSINPAPN